MSYVNKKLEKKSAREEVIQRMITISELDSKKQLANKLEIRPDKISKFITRHDLSFYKRIIDFAEEYKLSLDELVTGKKPVEKAGEYATNHHKEAVGIYEYTLPEAHRELVTKLVEILDGANRSNAVTIEQNVNAFHQTKDIPIPGEEEDDDKSASDGGQNKKKPQPRRESRTKTG